MRETLHPAIHNAGLELDIAPGRILRHPRQHSQARKQKLAQRDLDLIELESIDNNLPESRIFLAQGEAYVNLGNYDKAREFFAKAIQISLPGSTEMLEGYYGLLTGYNNNPTQSDAQMRICLNALEIFPLDTQLLLAIGNYFQTRNCLDLAVRAFETAVKFGQTNLSTWHLCQLPEVAASCLTMTLQLQGKQDEACKVVQEALIRHPNAARLERLALDLSVKTGNVDLAIQMARKVYMVGDGESPLVMAVRGACKAAKQEWTPALAYLQSAYLMGCRNAFCLRWLAVTLLSNGQGEAAKPVLAEWQNLEPANKELLAYLAAVYEANNPETAVPERELVENNKEIRQYRVDSPNGKIDHNPIRIPAVRHSNSSEPGL